MASENARIFIDKGSISLLFSAKTVMDKNIKNIIFDLGGVLVGLNPERCINAFREIGCGVLASYVEEHRTEDLFLETELGRIGEGEFCNEVRRIAHTDTPDKDIVWAWNQLLTGIPHEKLLRLARLKQQGYRLFLLSNTNSMHWNRCRDYFFTACQRLFRTYLPLVRDAYGKTGRGDFQRSSCHCRHQCSRNDIHR